MRQRFEWLFTPRKPYTDPLMAQRARGLLIFIAISLVITAIVAGVILVGSQAIEVENDRVDVEQFATIATPFLLILGFWLVREGYYQVAAIGLVVLALIAVSQIATGDLQTSSVITLILPMVSAGMLLGWRSTLLTLAAVLIMIARPTLFAPSLTTNYEDFLLIGLVLSILGFLLVVFGSNIQGVAARSLKELRSLRDMIATTLGHRDVRDEMELARDVIDLIRDQLGFPFARLFMVESGEVTQRIQTGLNRKQMTSDTDFDLSVSSAIYEAVRRKQVVALNLQSSDALRQHLLQGTRGALAVPINYDNEVIAVLDIQSEDIEVFETSDVNVIRFVAQQLGTSLGQSHRLSALRNELNAQELTMQRQLEKLLNYERRERQATTQAWVNYLKQRGMDYMGFDMNSNEEPNPAYTLTDDMQPAIQTGDISLRIEGEQQILSVPIILRGYTLGAMSFRVPEGNQTIGPRQQELIRSVVQRLGLALENKRLFEQSQAQAQRESKANEVGNLLLTSTDIETVLRLAADSFNQAMGSVQTQIRLRPESKEHQANGNGSEGAS
jgi:GAF domain-containing protein